MATAVSITGRRHFLKLSAEVLPVGTAGYLYVLKHPLRREFDSYLGRALAGGLFQVRRYGRKSRQKRQETTPKKLRAIYQTRNLIFFFVK